MRPKINFTAVDEEEEVVTPDPPKNKTISFTPIDEEEPVKKKESAAPSPSSTASPAPGKPSEQSTPPSTPTKYKYDPSVGKWTNLYRELVQAYNTPVTAEQKAKEKPDAIGEAIQRGKRQAEIAGIVGPFEGKPTEEKIKKVAQLQKETVEHKPSEALQKVNEAKSFTDAAIAFSKDPVKILVEQTAESMTSMALYGGTRIAAGAAIGSVVPGVGTGGGAIVGMADTSLGLEFSGSFMESLQQAGVDTKDPKQLKAAFENEEVISQARTHAFKKGIPIAIFDLVSGGIAGKLVAKPAKSLIGKTAAGAVELLTQSGLGATGELAGQVVAGEKIQPGAILMEALGETTMAPIEITTGALTYNKSPKEVVQEQTAQVDPTDQVGLDAKAEVIQDKVAANEPTIAAGNIDARPITPIDDQTTQVAPTEPTGPAAIPETKTEEEVQTQGDQKVEEDINQPKTLPLEDTPQPTEEETRKQAAREQIDALVESGDLKRDGKKVTVLTEKGSTELKRIVAENQIEKTPVPKQTNQFMIGITAATSKIPEIKALMDQGNEMQKAGDYEGRDKVFNQILDIGEKVITESLTGIKDASIKLNRTAGSFFGYAEPTFQAELTVSAESQQQAIAALSNASEKMSQDNVHISEIFENLPEGEEFGVENQDGTINEPNVNLTFEKPLSEAEIKQLEEIVQGEAEIASLTINSDRKGINLYNITKFGTNEEFLAKITKLKELLNSRGISPKVEGNIRRLLNVGNQEYGATRTYEEVRGQNVQSQEKGVAKKHAVQEPSPTSLDVREQARDGGAVAEGNIQQQAAQESQGEKVEPSESPIGPDITTNDVHAVAQAAGIDIDSKEFKKESRNVTGKEHLDDMTPEELGEMIRYIEATTEAAPPSTPQTGSVALDEPEEKQVSGIKKALVPESKVEATPVEKRTMEGMLASAKADVASGAVNPKAIVDEIATGNARALQPHEVAGLVYYKTQLDNKANQLNNALVDAIKNKDVGAIANLQPQVDAINQEIDRYHTMAVKTAYEQSLAFSMRKMLLDSEYNLASQVAAYKAVNNGVIEPEVENRFKELDKELKAANAQIAKLEEEKAKGKSEEALLAARQALQRQREQRKAAASSRKEKINEFFNSLKAKPDSKRFNSITQVIGEAVYNGAIDAIRLAVLAGSDAATAIQAGVDYINEHYRGNDFNEQGFRDVVTPGVEKLVPPTKEPPKITMTEDDKLVIPHSIIRDLVENQGITKIEDLVEAIKELISEEFPDLTDREIRDAITRYGETRKMSQDEINKQIREMKRMGKLISALEDVQNKKRPLRSGLQRDKLSDEERRLQREIKEGMKDLPVDEEEQAKSWKTALDAVKARLKNRIADIKHQIKTGEKTPKKAGIKYDQEAAELQAERDRLQKILEAMEGKQVMTDEQRVRNAVAAVERTIKDLEERIATKTTDAKQRKTTPETPELKALRDRRGKLLEQYDQMEKDLGVADKKKLEAVKKAVARATENFENRIKTRDFETKKKTPIKEDVALTKAKLRRDAAKEAFDTAREKARLANRPWNEKAYDAFIDIWNVPKSLQATIDMSAPFRQGLILTVSHPLSGLKAFKEMFLQAWSEQRAKEWMLALKDSDLYPAVKQSKLYIAEPNARLTAKEENFLSNFAKKIPIFGEGFQVGKFKVPGLGLISKSERAYSGYLNKLRVDVFASGIDQLRNQKMTPENNPEAFKAWADFINNATGRGNLGKLELAAPTLNGLFFSPRYLASRFNLLNPVKYAKMPLAVRKMALKSMFAYIGFVSLFVGLLAASSDDLEVDWDSRSSDFGKLKFGNTRFDLLAGFSQVIRFITQFTIAQKKNTTDGQIVELNGKKFPFENRVTVLGRFFRTKLAPVPGSLWNIWEGKNMVGEPATVQSELVRSVVPLYLQDLNEILEEEGPTGVIMTAIPAFFGIGVQSYKPKDKKKKGLIQHPERKLIAPLKIGHTKRDVEE